MYKYIQLLKNNKLNYNETIEILKQAPCYLEFIKNQTEEMQWIAVKHDPWYLSLCRDPTEEIINYCINKNPLTVGFINADIQVIKKCIRRNWRTILYIKKINLELCRYTYKIAKCSVDYFPSDLANIILLENNRLGV